MFVRVKKSGPREYLQVAESRWEDGATRQRVVATLGRLDKLQAHGDVDGLMRSLARFADRVRVVQDAAAGRLEALSARRIGPALVFERLWRETGIADVLARLAAKRRFAFPVERAVFLSVLHRLFAPGSDRQAERWRADYRIAGTESLALHHLYRAMAWLGEARQAIEKRLFGRRRTLFTEGDLVFFDTTSIYFEGRGGETIGRYGASKDHRRDRVQMIVGAVIDSEGMPICAPMWPGNRTDVKALLPVVKDLRRRFGIRRMSVVADRGMISKETVEGLEGFDPPVGYILGARMRSTKEVRDEVLGRGGRYAEVRPNLQVKEVRVGERRYVICLNPEEAERDAAARAAIVESLEGKLREGVSGLIANRGYRRFLKVRGEAVAIDPTKVEQDARYDGKFVLRTNLDIPADELALRYKELWRVERLFRSAKSLLATRPIFHHCDATICGHVFVSFLALMLLHELDVRQEARPRRLSHGNSVGQGGRALAKATAQAAGDGAPAAANATAEWADVRRDLDALQEVEVSQQGRTYWLRTPMRAGATAAFRAAGVAIPPNVREA